MEIYIIACLGKNPAKQANITFDCKFCKICNKKIDKCLEKVYIV